MRGFFKFLQNTPVWFFPFFFGAGPFPVRNKKAEKYVLLPDNDPRRHSNLPLFQFSLAKKYGQFFDVGGSGIRISILFFTKTKTINKKKAQQFLRVFLFVPLFKGMVSF